jgi:hypothetical protein
MGPVFTLCLPAGLVIMRSLADSGRPTAPTISLPTPKASPRYKYLGIVDRHGFFRKGYSTPVQLTTGPLAFDHALPS